MIYLHEKLVEIKGRVGEISYENHALSWILKKMSELSPISFRTNIMLNIEFSSSLFHVSLQNKL